MSKDMDKTEIDGVLFVIKTLHSIRICLFKQDADTYQPENKAMTGAGTFLCKELPRCLPVQHVFLKPFSHQIEGCRCNGLFDLSIFGWASCGGCLE